MKPEKIIVMAQAAPGKSYPKSISLSQLFKMFPNDETARQWIEDIVWPDGPCCPYCGSDNVQSDIQHKSMTHRCRDCEKKPRFSVKTGTVMQSSKLGYQTWAVAAYLVTTSLKSVSSMKLHRDLNITQKSAWHLAHRLRKTYELGLPMFSGPVEADETFVGGVEKNKHANQKLNAGRGGVDEVIVAGAKDRKTNTIVARIMSDTKAATLQGFVETISRPDAQIDTDEGLGYSGLNRPHGVVWFATARASMYGTWRISTELKVFGRLSSAHTRARFTSSARNICTATSMSFQANIMFAPSTRLTRWPQLLRA